MPSAPTVRTLSSPVGGEGEGGARQRRRRDRRELELDLGGHAVGDREVGVVELDLDAIGARADRSRSARRSGRRPSAVWPVTRRTSARSPTLIVAELPLGDLGDGEHRVERDDLGHHARSARSAWPVVTGTSLTTPEIGARIRPRSCSALAMASAASAARRSACELVLVVGGDDAALDQLQLRLEVGLALLRPAPPPRRPAPRAPRRRAWR